MKKVEILWTGGYDSSLRMAQLSRKEIVIEPYYLSDNRKSERYERAAMETIYRILTSDSHTRAEILLPQYIPMQSRQTSQDISEAYGRLRKQDFMGSQYEWLSIFSTFHVGIELSVHQDDKALELIAKHGNTKKVTDEILGDYYVIDPSASSEDLVKVFGNFRFPLATYTKLEMKQEYEALGLTDVMRNTWFCFHPVLGKPCGFCNPCTYTMQEGMKERFTKMGLLRYHVYSSVFSPTREAVRKFKTGKS